MLAKTICIHLRPWAPRTPSAPPPSRSPPVLGAIGWSETFPSFHLRSPSLSKRERKCRLSCSLWITPVKTLRVRLSCQSPNSVRWMSGGSEGPSFDARLPPSLSPSLSPSLRTFLLFKFSCSCRGKSAKLPMDLPLARFLLPSCIVGNGKIPTDVGVRVHGIWNTILGHVDVILAYRRVC